ncbi:MAG: DUF4910 domain-containing protein [Pseudobdellovibrionaceae bacterium]
MTNQIIEEWVANWRSAGITQGDTVLIHSSISRTIKAASKKYQVRLTPDNLLDSFLQAVGDAGTIIMPLFNFDFAKGTPFDIRTTPSHMGVLTEAARLHPKAVRTGHPIYSFAVIGARASEFEGLCNESGYGSDSPFAKLLSLKGKIAVLDLEDQNSMTFYHFVEEAMGVHYRYFKTFNADYTDKFGFTSGRSFKLFVRKLQEGVVTDVNSMGEKLWSENLYKGMRSQQGHGLRTITAETLFEVTKQVILENRAKGLLYSLSFEDSSTWSQFRNAESGLAMHQFGKDLFEIPRSLTGHGVRKTLGEIKNHLPQLVLHEVPSGTQVFDWVVPKEWNFERATLHDSNGNCVIDTHNNNLHVVGYSTPIEKVMSREELEPHLFSLPKQPEAIPYITSYYSDFWGLCVSDNCKKALKDSSYKVTIRATKENGSLTYGDMLIPGESEKEVLFSTYVCHPQMANNELSGPLVTTWLAKWISQLPKRRYTYRFYFGPETIGAVTYLAKNFQQMKKETIAGWIVTCVGDEKNVSFLPGPNGNSFADRISRAVLKDCAPYFKEHSFLDRGSDERQFCSPGIDLPIASIMRSKYATFPEYHTSLDDFNFVTPEGLDGALALYKGVIEVLENNCRPSLIQPCEPQLGKRGLYPKLSTLETGKQVYNMMNFLAYCDGKNDLIDISQLVQVPIFECLGFLKKFSEAKLLTTSHT